MTGSIEFFFDFVSPYGYIASKSIEALAARHSRSVQWRPMLLGISVIKVMGLKPIPMTPLKGDYAARDIARTVRRLGLTLGRDLASPPQGAIVPARATAWARRRHPDAVASLVHSLYHAIWSEGINFDEPADLLRVPLPSQIEAQTLRDAAGSKEAADMLRTDVQESIDRGIFGSPTVVVDGEPFWGADRLDEAELWLQRGGW